MDQQSQPPETEITVVNPSLETVAVPAAIEVPEAAQVPEAPKAEESAPVEKAPETTTPVEPLPDATEVEQAVKERKKFVRLHVEVLKEDSGDGPEVTGLQVIAVNSEVMLTVEEAENENSYFSTDKHNGPIVAPARDYKVGDVINL